MFIMCMQNINSGIKLSVLRVLRFGRGGAEWTLRNTEKDVIYTVRVIIF